jgi:hypothetical protein
MPLFRYVFLIVALCSLLSPQAQAQDKELSQPLADPLATRSPVQSANSSQPSQQTKQQEAAPPKANTPTLNLQIARASTPPKLEDYLDGKTRADEVRVTGFRQRDPRDGIPVSQETTAYLSYDDKNLYVIFVCKDDPSQVRAHMSKREDAFSDDLIGITLDTFHDRRRAYLFGTNPLGIQLDGIVSEGQNDDYSFDTLWYSQGKLTADGYVVWMSIPFKSLRFDNADVQTWGVALIRNIARNNESAFWPYITRRVEGFTQQFANLEGLQKISPGRNIQIIPYGFFARARFLDTNIPQVRTKNEFRGGVDAKVVFHDSFTLDITANPDFSQVESDEPQVLVNQRFEVFFPEKRPFFLENTGFFQTPETLLFSRRIADPQIGLRLTGKLDHWTIGALASDDRAPGKAFPDGDRLHDERAAIGVLRVQREWQNQSSAGFMMTSRDFASSSNRVIAADTRLKLNQNWVFSGQAIQSFTRQLNGEHLSGPAFTASLNRSSRHFENFFNYTDRSPDFRTQLGFFPRVDIRDLSNFATYRWRPKTGRLQSFGFNLFTEAIWNHKGDLQDWRVNLPFVASFAGNTEIFIRRAEFADSFAGVRVREHTNDINFSTGFLKWLSFFANLTTGVQANFFPTQGLPYGAKTLNTSTGFTLRPISQFAFSQLYIYNRLGTREGHLPPGESQPASIFNNHILRSKLNYQVNRALSFRAILDYNSILPNENLVGLERDKNLTADFLMTYLVNPGTALYVGYTDGYRNLQIDPVDPSMLRRIALPTASTGRQFFVKMSYLLRF